MESAVTEQDQPGRPRDDRIDRSALRVTAEMALVMSYGELSLTAIAKEARTSRAALHRRWNSKAELVLEAFVANTAAVVDHDTGSLRGDLESLTRQNAELFTSPRHRGLAIAALDALGDLGLDYPGIPQPRTDTISSIFERAAGRGDLPEHASPEVVTQLLAGAVLFRSVVLNEPLSDDDISDLVTAVLGASRTSV